MISEVTKGKLNWDIFEKEYYDMDRNSGTQVLMSYLGKDNGIRGYLN